MEVTTSFCDEVGICNMLHVLVKLGITEATIAEYCGLNQSSVSRIRSGIIKNPSYRAIKKLEKLYQSSINAQLSR
jgi:transcriptional regulator with XRE-family HTH domain